MKFSLIQNIFFFLALALLSVMFMWLISGFAFPIFFAIVLSIIFYPFYKKVLRLTKGRSNLAATISLFSVLLLIIVPTIAISSLVIKESTEIYQNISSSAVLKEDFFGKYEIKIKETVESFSLNYLDLKEKAIEMSKKTLSYITSKSLNFGKDTLSVFGSFLIMTYIMFYLFRDGKKFLEKISKILPLGDGNEKKAFNKFVLIIKSIFRGSLIVALIQGLIGAFLLYITGVDALFLWTILMIILAIIPALGPTIVLVPMAIFMFVIGDNFNGGLLLAGTAIVSVSDNILRPIFIGNSIKMHDLILTLSILGGIMVFGILGFIIGPVISGLFILAWELFEEKYSKQLKERG